MRTRLAAALAGAWLATVPAARASATAEAPLARKVLALYHKERIPGKFKDIAFHALHLRAELILNYLGLEVEYLDALGELPDPATLGDYRGVLTWFDAPVNFEKPERVCRWLDAAMARGVRLVVLGDPGLYAKPPPGAQASALAPDCAAMFKTLGVRLSGSVPVDPIGVSLATMTPSLVGFERKLDLRDVDQLPLVDALPGSAAHLRLNFAEGPVAGTTPVVLTPRGGLALQPFWLYSNEELSPPQFRWIVDPFAFLEEALQTRHLPRPDVTTMNGRRVYLTQIDGDGFFNVSEVNLKKYSGQIFLEEFLTRYSSSPFTVSLITSYYELPAYNDAASLSLSRKILNLPNVEPASHGYAHPLIWHQGTVAVTLPGYKMDPRREILGSVDFLNARILSGRKASLFLWTGDGLPSESDVLLAEKAGLLNLNGGGGRFDSRFPSYAFLRPLSRKVGKARQVYTPVYNENDFTNLWQGPYYGYREAIETFERSGAPRRIKPANVYVHFYSAEKYAAVEALRKVYAWAHARPLFPVFASRYVRSVRGFFDMRIVRLGPDRYRFEGGEDLRTVRFDGTPLHPDLAASKGVIGYRRELGSLYVFFDESPTRELRLAKTASPGPFLVEADFEVSGWQRRGRGLRFLRRGWWKGEFSLGGLPPGARYKVSSAGSEALVAADAQGVLQASFRDSERGGPAREVLVEPAG